MSWYLAKIFDEHYCKANGPPIVIDIDENSNKFGVVLSPKSVEDFSRNTVISAANFLKQYSTLLNDGKRWNGSYLKVWLPAHAYP